MTRIVLSALLLSVTGWAAQDCASLRKLSLEHASVASAEETAAGSFKAPGAASANARLPAFCRVQVISKPSADSNIKLEVWMPLTAWNGKFLGVGNGGFAGSINHDSLAEAVRNGYATASTDTGHEAGGVDASWALGHPEKTTDFGYRGIHEMTVDAEALIQSFYGMPAKRAYFNGCSNGGRQALMEAQRYPDDYEGILAGAPANYWTHLLATSALNAQALLASGASYISPKKLPAIQGAALAACDAQDGVKDGVIDNPVKCHFDPAVLQCKGAEGDACLTLPQLEALRTLYAGSRIFPGYPPGAEADRGGWDVWITGPSPARSLMFGFATQFYKNMQFSNPAWDFRTFHEDKDVKATDDKLAGTLNATDADLSKFQARGGKLILYHGWNDPAIAAPNTVNYYGSVMEKMGAGRGHSFVRLFMAPGMLHCSGGDGPSDFGQFSLGGDAEHNLDAALERWVEQGVAPEQVVATKRKNVLDTQSEVIRTRPLCAYPLVAKYKGSGSTDEAGNFTCAK